ncbi:putative ABC transport system permease protein [Promicromonospora umidemergens]|uniref:ABC3 transporter permease C-terminal domain-containing protein n=1 Tax=Promicromonospora umidemergens TaxID=629679 RepID=A0ABP8XJ67_9MICO|nr:FtsX-like permease family protein [Promicromonospora umidemergens]MCP2282207.1 putative ABC transport system permease protein [Promicromonospora umidemergens]
MRRRTLGRWSQGPADLLEDVLIELSSRRARALMMVAAVGLSTGALLASVGISAAASAQIGSDIAASTLDLMTVSVAPTRDGEGAMEERRASASDSASPDSAIPDSASPVLPDDTERRLREVDLIEAGGRRLDVSLVASPVVTRLPSGDEPGREGAASPPDVVALTSGYLAAARTPGPSERYFLLDRTEPVVLLGETAAGRLDVPVTDDPTGLQVSIDGSPYDVAGFLGGEGPAALADAVVVPYATGVEMAGDDREAEILIRSVPGAGTQVAKVAALAVRPAAPERLSVSPVVSVDSLRRGVSTQLDRLAAWTGTILMGLTILLIANSMVIAVMARTAEIGLRRALGCSRAQVAAVFLTEGLLIGLLGGLVGAAVAAAAVVATSAANGWTAVLHPGWIALGPVIGAGVGLIASVYPARRAAAISPALAVRSE